MAVAQAKVFIPGMLGTQRVKARRDLREMGFLYLAVFAFIVLISVVFVYLGSRLAYFNTGYELSELGRSRAELMEKKMRLTVTLERLKSPERIERIATGELGLGYPEANQVLRVR